ncbi:MAG: aldehyde dehydrogenase [Deltaproteobacteria bacterium]|nr:aldehyde dehydrogenase [Deltaproteobacteria bacterium]
MAKKLRKYGLFINGKEVNAKGGKTYIRENPATEEPFAEIAEAQKSDIDKAVKAAGKAFEKWSKVPVSERVKYVHKIAEILEKNREKIALTNTLETGKPIRESRLVELGGAIKTLQYYASISNQLNGESISVSDAQLTVTIREPIGVVGQIIPWNFPLLLSFWKIAPALVAGCTIVLKPAEHTPCGILEVAELCTKAGLPDGVLNVVPGDGEVAGQVLVEHPGVAKVAFTGSTQVGKIVMKTAADTIKRVSLELGGKAPCIVFDDAEIDNTIEATLRGGFFNQGENCTAVTRLLLHENIYDKFLSTFIKRVKKIRIGDPLRDDTELGSVISREHFDNVKSYFQKGKKEGGKVLSGGKRPRKFKKGYFFEPTVIADVDPKATIACEEIFGPIVAVIPFKTEAEAVKIANDTVYGLAGGIWTQDIKRALRVAKNIKAGYLWVNTYGGIIPETPYGGLKQSGIGKELGKDGLNMYLESKTVNIFIGDKIPAFYKG